MQPNETHYSNKDYKRLGDRIRNKPHDIAPDDLLMLQQLRMSYKEPLATIFNAIERLAHNVDKDCICTSWLTLPMRMPTASITCRARTLSTGP